MELFKRAFVGIFGGSIFIFMLMYNKWTYFFLFGFIKTTIFLEFRKFRDHVSFSSSTLLSLFSEKQNNNKFVISNFIINLLVLLISITIYCLSFAIFANYINNYRVFLLLLCILPSCFLLLFLFNIKYDFNSVCVDILSFCYITLPFSAMHYLLFIKPYLYNKFILVLFLLIWISDSGAYFVGTAIGKIKLFERVSPKKTWEGFLGGGACTFLASYLLYIIFEYQLCWYMLALLVSITSTLGDLIASLIKRTFNVKDSGSLLPGHGGFLDRFDSFLITLPFFLLYIYTQYK